MGGCGVCGVLGLEVCDDEGPGEGLADVAGDAARDLVAAVDGPVAGDLDVQRDELAGAGLAGLEFVELDAGFLVGVQDALCGGLVLGGQG